MPPTRPMLPWIPPPREKPPPKPRASADEVVDISAATPSVATASARMVLRSFMTLSCWVRMIGLIVRRLVAAGGVRACDGHHDRGDCGALLWPRSNLGHCWADVGSSPWRDR